MSMSGPDLPTMTANCRWEAASHYRSYLRLASYAHHDRSLGYYTSAETTQQQAAHELELARAYAITATMDW